MTTEKQPPQAVKIVGVDISFGDLILLMFKIVLASIPVAIVVTIAFFILTIVFAALGVGLRL